MKNTPPLNTMDFDLDSDFTLDFLNSANEVSGTEGNALYDHEIMDMNQENLDKTKAVDKNPEGEVQPVQMYTSISPFNPIYPSGYVSSDIMGYPKTLTEENSAQKMISIATLSLEQRKNPEKLFDSRAGTSRSENEVKNEEKTSPFVPIYPERYVSSDIVKYPKTSTEVNCDKKMISLDTLSSPEQETFEKLESPADTSENELKNEEISPGVTRQTSEQDHPDSLDKEDEQLEESLTVTNEDLNNLDKLLNETVNSFQKVYDIKTGKKLIRKNKIKDILSKKEKKVLIDLLDDQFPKEIQVKLAKTAEKNLEIMNAVGYFSMRLIQFCANPIKYFCEEF